MKYWEIIKYYRSYEWKKTNLANFYQRINKFWLTKEEAIKPLHRHIKTKFTIDWRICTQCWVKKLWSDFAKDKTWLNKRSPNCLECRNKNKIEYRKSKEVNEKEKEYKRLRRLKNPMITKLDNIYYCNPTIKNNRKIIWKVNRKQAFETKIQFLQNLWYEINYLLTIYRWQIKN